MFLGEDNFHQLDKIVEVLGSKELDAYMKKYNAVLNAGFQGVLKEHQGREWESFVNEKNKETATPEAIALLRKMLVYDHVISKNTGSFWSLWNQS